MSIDTILSTKALERQIKILEEKILDLEAQVSELEKKREACHILLGVPVKPISESVEAASSMPKPVPRKKKPKEEKLAEVEAVSEETFTATEPGAEIV